jgi:hypothetical protein
MPHWTIREASALPDGRLVLTFADGLHGVVALTHAELTGVLAHLRDPQYFVQMRLIDGVPTWPDGEDLAPDGLYEDVRHSQAIA